MADPPIGLALTHASVPVQNDPNATDILYIEDSGTGKRITVPNLMKLSRRSIAVDATLEIASPTTGAFMFHAGFDTGAAGQMPMVMERDWILDDRVAVAVYTSTGTPPTDWKIRLQRSSSDIATFDFTFTSLANKVTRGNWGTGAGVELSEDDLISIKADGSSVTDLWLRVRFGLLEKVA